MVLIWPNLLTFLFLIPLLAALYLWVLRRNRRTALRYSSLALIRPALQRQSRLRRYIPPALFLLALASLVTALARPFAVYTTLTNQTTILLAMDVSGSMNTRDIQPTRLAAAQKAALDFVRSQKTSAQIGIVAFSSSAQLIQAPTNNQAELETAIRSLSIGDMTAIGSGMLEGLRVITRMHQKNSPPETGAKPGAAQTPSSTPAHVPEILVLLTDGQNNIGPEPEDVAKQAAEQGVRVYTIGYGPDFSRVDLAVNPFHDPQAIIPDTGGADGNTRVFGSPNFDFDPKMLKMIADVTGGKTYTATNAKELEKIFAGLPITMAPKTESNEISAVFVALGALLAAAAMALSMLWHPLP